jgi:hypothetical protein
MWLSYSKVDRLSYRAYTPDSWVSPGAIDFDDTFGECGRSHVRHPDDDNTIR